MIKYNNKKPSIYQYYYGLNVRSCEDHIKEIKEVLGLTKIDSYYRTPFYDYYRMLSEAQLKEHIAELERQKGYFRHAVREDRKRSKFYEKELKK